MIRSGPKTRSPDVRSVIRSVLIANRGEIAVRIARTCRRARDPRPSPCSATPTRAPSTCARATRPCTCRATRRPTRTCASTSSSMPPARAGADAVHPGYGFLAESAAFAQAVVDAGLTWIGPPPAAIAAMGSKIEAKALMRAAGVPVLPDSSVEGVDDVAAIGFPLLVKASAGGGGRGMRIVRSAAELDDALAAAEREADGRVRRRHRVLRALRRARPPHRDPGLRRHPRQGRVAVRARLLDPAPPPEDRRGGPVSGGRRGPRASGCQRPRSPRRAPWTTSAPAPSSSCSTPQVSSGSWR